MQTLHLPSHYPRLWGKKRPQEEETALGTVRSHCTSALGVQKNTQEDNLRTILIVEEKPIGQSFVRVNKYLTANKRIAWNGVDGKSFGCSVGAEGNRLILCSGRFNTFMP